MRDHILVERYYPFVLGAVALFTAYHFGAVLPTETRKEILAAAISVGAILAGFLGTVKAIMMALPSALLQKLRTSGYMDVLAEYLGHALFGSLGLSVLSVVGLFPVEESYPIHFAAIWFAWSTFAVCAFWRVTGIMLGIFRLA